MWKDKPTGIKILWVWTIGTALVLLTTVSRTRMHDMEKFMNETEHQHQQQHYREGASAVDSVMSDDSSFSSDGIIKEDK
ncbi:hypothetical protein RND81_12G170000 [Saponaria officinalis]|uniref:Uncharacterized protein n=1 Tax=Saponaria officinalis TaxID=3572 RepID=A0AAW1HBQ1_SAPOF